MTIRTLILSGGGGRGAFHAGVYKYLMQEDKPGIDEEHSRTWTPDIVVGTSIGAVNGAAIVQGVSAEELERFWLSLRENDVQGLPPGMGWLARRFVNSFMKRSIGVPLAHMPPEQAFSPSAEESWPPLPLLPRWLGEKLIGRWSNLLDTGPLYRTLQERLKLDEAKIAASDKTLFISATNVHTGEAAVFCNQPVPKRQTGEAHPQVTLQRIMASCSIPMVYPWTQDEDGAVYWDGAVVLNTPLSPAFDATRDRPMTEPMEAVIVMMTPWWETDEEAPHHDRLPQDFGEAMTWTLDWALLASFRVDLKLTRSYNRQASRAMEAGEEPDRRYVKVVIVSPAQFLPVARIIDYDEPASRELIKMGYEAAERAFQTHFGG